MEQKKPSRQCALVNKTETIYQGKLFSFVKEDVTLPNKQRTEMAIVRHPGSTAIVPLFKVPNIITWQNFFHPATKTQRHEEKYNNIFVSW